MNKPRTTNYRVGDEVSYALPSGMLYGTVVKVLGSGDAVELEFEGGRKEIKKSGDRALSLLRRASGLSEADERGAGRPRVHDPEVERIRRSEQRKR
jgi:hypothetical protein